MAFEELIINYQTAPTVPPPYSFACSVILRQANDRLDVSLSQNYTDREELEEEEITAEGFTLNDDFAWNGSLPSIWLNEINALFLETKWEDHWNEDGESPYLELSVKAAEKDTRIVFPADPTAWDYLLNELMQATFEAAEKENPFHLTYCQIEKGHRNQTEIEASFVLRKVQVHIGQQKPKPLSWEVLREIFNLIYHQADFISENGTPERPEKPGSYISAGDGLWYKLGEGIINVNPRNKATQNIKELFERLQTERR